MFDIDNPKEVDKIPEDFTAEDLNNLVTALNSAREGRSKAEEEVRTIRREKEEVKETNRNLLSRISTGEQKKLKQPEEYLAEMFGKGGK